MHTYRALSLSCLFVFGHAFAAEGFFMHGLYAAPKQSVEKLLDEALSTARKMEFAANPLTIAINADDSERVCGLIQGGQQVDGLQLHLAVLNSVVQKNDGRVVKLLIAQKAPVDFKVEKIGTPLMIAASKNRVDLVAMLLEAGAVPNMIDKNGNTALHYAAIHNAGGAARCLLDVGRAFGAPCNHLDFTPAHLAAINNSVRVLGVLADHADYRADLSLRHPVSYRTALALAFRQESEDAALVLIKKRAGIETPDREGKTPLHEAAGVGLVRALRALLPLVACNVQDEQQRTPLMYAVLERQVPAVDILLEAGARVDLPDYMGNTALHIAAVLDMVDIVGKLLARGASPFAQNKNGIYPKDYTKNPAILKLLESQEKRATTPESSSSSYTSPERLSSDESTETGSSYTSEE